MRQRLKKLLFSLVLGGMLINQMACAQREGSSGTAEPANNSGHLEFSGTLSKVEDFGLSATKKVACMSYPSRSYITLITLGSEESRSISEQLVVNFAASDFPQGSFALDERAVAFRTIKSSYWNGKENCVISISHNGVKLKSNLKCALQNSQGEQIVVSASVDCVIFK